MSKLLLDEKPLMVMPKLATKIGLNEAIILQQIHYWNEINEELNNNYKDGYNWTFNSVLQWQEQFPFWSKNTIQRSINNLEKMKLLVVGNYNKLPIDRTKWYRIDYKVLSALEQSPFTQIGATNTPEWVNHLTKLGLPLPESNSESNSENNNNTITSNGGLVLIHYSNAFKEKYNKEHPTITKDQLDYVELRIEEMTNEHGIVDWYEIIDEYFEELSDKNDGNILSFVSGDIHTGPIMRYIL